MSDIIDYYSRFDEWGRLSREPLEFTVNWHYITTHLPPNGAILDNGAGPGKYSMELAKHGYRVTLTDLTPNLVEIAKKKIHRTESIGML
ncbi:class I SAM-dependent methyltransferase [Cohnella kolymensis]|uniref:class I SAM-dependent methyltransferase n=1 Tax=Cohnella kolymensis TaxID=1590652 RepID=UPI000B29F37D|nr:methyltransferase domain-containing protein [Cohnella kolymensis]